ncbi:ATP-binding cassette domain-containing protein [Priestia megaterium]|uniref:ATP-binding cassette domain-containing protein n=1 Tax=Priestia megaterium TaxID=1404 RepID=UPI0027A3509D|nr:ABC transporter ATP-binding protein [Priestia megaterium]WDC91274.1 ABC transporter ATP-binding protein [Priestia megaterium]
MLNYIDINNLSVLYGNSKALNNITINFKKGSLYALIGHNGAGKTTLIKEILKVNTKRQEKISYLNKSQKAIKDKNIKYNISFSPEKPALLEELTVYEYISFVAKMYDSFNNYTIEKIDILLKIFNLDKVRHKFIFALSNGMKKKVCHIAALCLENDFTFLDEPFAALDPVAIYELKNYILSNYHKTTFIISTHQLDIINNLDIDYDKLNIAMLNKGNLVFSGSKTELLKDGEYSSIEEAYLNFHKEMISNSN